MSHLFFYPGNQHNHPPDYTIYSAGIKAVGRGILWMLNYIGESYLPPVRPLEQLRDYDEQLVAGFVGDLATERCLELTAQDWRSAENARQALQ